MAQEFLTEICLCCEELKSTVFFHPHSCDKLKAEIELLSSELSGLPKVRMDCHSIIN